MPRKNRVNLIREHASEYAAGEMPTPCAVEPALYLAVKGKGDLGAAAFKSALRILEKVAKSLRDAKREAGHELIGPRLEALFWPPHRGGAAWQLMVRVPDSVRSHELEQARDVQGARSRGAAGTVQLERLEEGQCLQLTQVGAFGGAKNRSRLNAHARKIGFTAAGPYHEIYLSDPIEKPERCSTIARLPVRAEVATAAAHRRVGKRAQSIGVARWRRGEKAQTQHQ